MLNTSFHHRNSLEDITVQVSFRLDDAREEKVKKIFAFYGFTSAAASDNYKAVIDMLYDLTQNRINSHIVASALESGENKDIDIACPMRFYRAEKFHDVDLSTKQLFWTKIKKPYCMQFEKGKRKKPQEIFDVNFECAKCKVLTENWIKEQKDLCASEPEPIHSNNSVQAFRVGNSLPDKMVQSRPVPQPIKPAIPEPVISKPANTFECERKQCGVHYSICLNECRKKRYPDYYACRMANPDIAKALDYWINQSSGKT